MNNRFLITGIFLFFIIISGYVLSRSAKPMNSILLTVHKVISLGALVYLASTIYQTNKIAPLHPFGIVISVITSVLFIALIATGGFLSAAKPMPSVVHKIHQILPYFLILTSMANLYILQA